VFTGVNIPLMKKNPLDIINNRYNSLRESEKKVARYIQGNFDQVLIMSLQTLAEKCSVSDATALRFCRSLGYKGFSDFKVALLPGIKPVKGSSFFDRDKGESVHPVKEKMALNLREQITSSLRNCDYQNIIDAGKAIIRAEKILVIGLGGSAGIAHILVDSLSSLGIFSACVIDRSIFQNSASVLGEKDIVIGISHSGELQEVVTAMRIAKDRGATTISVTNFSPSAITEVSEIVLLTNVPDQLLGSYSCYPRISQLSILEMVLYEIAQNSNRV